MASALCRLIAMTPDGFATIDVEVLQHVVGGENQDAWCSSYGNDMFKRHVAGAAGELSPTPGADLLGKVEQLRRGTDNWIAECNNRWPAVKSQHGDRAETMMKVDLPFHTYL